jgi:AcrR family transcriptional regulator
LGFAVVVVTALVVVVGFTVVVVDRRVVVVPPLGLVVVVFCVVVVVLRQRKKQKRRVVVVASADAFFTLSWPVPQAAAITASTARTTNNFRGMTRHVARAVLPGDVGTCQCYNISVTVTSTTDRILDATYEDVLHFGVKGVSIERIARRVGVARITIYRRFTNKEALLGAMAAREAERIFGRIGVIVAAHGSLEDQIVEGFAEAMSAVRHHPLIQRTLVSERDVIMRFTELQAGSMLGVAREFVAMLVAAQRPKLDARAVAEVMLRIGVTFLLIPESTIKLATANEARAFARRFLVPMLNP